MQAAICCPDVTGMLKQLCVGETIELHRLQAKNLSSAYLADLIVARGDEGKQSSAGLVHRHLPPQSMGHDFIVVLLVHAPAAQAFSSDVVQSLHMPIAAVKSMTFVT